MRFVNKDLQYYSSPVRADILDDLYRHGLSYFLKKIWLCDFELCGKLCHVYTMLYILNELYFIYFIDCVKSIYFVIFGIHFVHLKSHVRTDFLCHGTTEYFVFMKECVCSCVLGCLIDDLVMVFCLSIEHWLNTLY